MGAEAGQVARQLPSCVAARRDPAAPAAVQREPIGKVIHHLLTLHVCQQRPQAPEAVISEEGRPGSGVAGVEIDYASGVEQEADLEGQRVNLGMAREDALEHVGATPASATAEDHRDAVGSHPEAGQNRFRGGHCRGVCHGYAKGHLVKHITPLNTYFVDVRNRAHYLNLLLPIVFQVPEH